MLDYRTPYILDIRYPGVTFNAYKQQLRDEANDLPVIAIKCEVARRGKAGVLKYWDIGAEHGHMVYGSIAKDSKTGLVFQGESYDATFTFTQLTYEEFERRIRPHLDDYVSSLIHDLDDVYIFYRKQAGIA